MRFLVLDDSPDDRLVAARLLRQAHPGAEVDEVSDPAGFERALGRDGYAAVVTDYLMRWTDGVRVLRRVKALWPDCPVVLFTGSGNEEVAVEAMKAGADDYVIKSPRTVGRLPLAVTLAMERVSARRRIEALEGHLLDLTEALDVGVFRATPGGDLLTCNGAFLRILGLESPGEARSVDLSGLLSPPGRADAMREAADGRAMARREKEIVRPDGGRVWVLISERVGDDAGRPVVDGLVEDISGRKQLERGLTAQAEELREADRRKDEFLAMLAHELRNPLSPIQSAAQILQLIPALHSDEHVRYACEVIERQTRALARLVDDLLDVSRVSRGKIVLHPEFIDLGLAVARAVETARPLVEARRHELKLQLPSEPVRVSADLTRLTQVLSNLLNNAAKFTPEGGRISVEAVREAGQAVVRVKDNGIGIAPDLLPRVFDLFTQGEVSIDRNQGGLGIGLTLAKRLVELHGGTLTAESHADEPGSTFTVRLPAALRPTPGGGPPAEARPSAGARLDILVVDDNRDAADVAALVLRTLGHSPRTVYDGPSAVAAVRESHPAVVFLDIGLPGMDGYEVARAIRADRDARDTVLVALTGYGSEEDRSKSREAGFDYHLMKPAEVEDIIRILRSVKL
ncbi:Autoinducer 2 sensor kinase/phosphatase LuxQ [Aquisphaera giovannonii]|uniref:histidine kinase n=1 Tax=Aquisphaera giovannonii TaxID=406548 RepID=A0A5B9WCS5_9BACT|nr:response regulator [Aquisphaera giovannonii]QEH38039.1 Autoinducer 2 sensor kinase/phosphatase LuxQ [Aquisphaera giovannonii]